MTNVSVGVETYAQAVRAFGQALAEYEEEINGLNVYPVPDGDTGTNLKLTLRAVERELDTSAEPCHAIVRGSLMGARGNSGVILSQILRGVTEAVAEHGGLTTETVARGLRRGSELAYAAVMQPEEGTILTVSREAAEEAEAARAEGEDLAGALRRVVGRAQDALDRTPELLPILRRAGVVDAGGRGLLLFLECLLHAVDGSPLTPPTVPAAVPAPAPLPTGGEGGSLQYAFEVQFLLETSDTHANEYRELLSTYGDCVLVVGGAGLFNVHVHTNDVGGVIEQAIERGRPRDIEVQYLQGQVDVRRHEAEVLSRLHEPPPQDTPRERLGLVAVAAGDGILEIFRSMGVKGLVSGGQTFNPSAEEILLGIRQARADEVIVLPNNPNVVGTARAAAAVAMEEGVAERVEVVPTESPLQGFTALVAFDREASLNENVEAMSREARSTKHGEVAYAVRTTETPAGHVEEGQAIALAGGTVRAVRDDPEEAVVALLESLVEEGDSLVTLVYGADVDEWSAHEFGRRIAERFGLEVEVHHGGQPHYPFLVGIE